MPTITSASRTSSQGQSSRLGGGSSNGAGGIGGPGATGSSTMTCVSSRGGGGVRRVLGMVFLPDVCLPEISEKSSPSMTAVKLDGAALAAKVRAEVASEVAELGSLGLATVLVGDDAASEIYI